MRRFIGILCLLILLAACGGDDEDSVSQETVASPTPAVLTVTPRPTVPTWTPVPSATTETTTNQTVATVDPNCTPRTDWPTYTVQFGDTLGGIALSVGSTAEELAEANCLASVDAIFSGQTIRVPSTTDDGNTDGGNTDGGGNTNTGNAPVLSQDLVIRPTEDLGDGSVISRQSTIALDVGVVNDADRVRYYAGISEDDDAPINIGTDSDPFDGTQVNYTFAEFDDALFFWAEAENEFGSTRSNTVLVLVDPTFDLGDSGTLLATPNLGFDGLIYTLAYDTTVEFEWPDPPSDAQAIEFYVIDNFGETVLVGTDTTPADGASATWDVPQWALATLTTIVYLPDGSQFEGPTVTLYSEGVGVPSN